jgi:hypothetical protein
MEHKNLINEFYWLFSKFEYALKMSGFHNGNGNAKADWRGFAAAIENDFDKNSSEALAKGAEYILKCPPKKQVVSDGSLEWSSTPPDSTSEVGLLLQYVCRVRNNLFHGGKYRGKVLDNPDRSEQLINGCRSILNHCLELSPKVREAFEGNTT